MVGKLTEEVTKMLSFKKFCHLVLRREVYTIKADEKGERSRVRVGPEIFKLLNEEIPKAEIFVFNAYAHELSHSVEAELQLVSVDKITVRPEQEKNIVQVNIDVPFKTTFFEAVDPNTNEPTFGAFTIEKYDCRNGGRRFVSSDLVNESGPMLVIETAPKTFVKFMLLRQLGEYFIVAFNVTEEIDDGKFNILKIYLSKLENQLVAHEVVNEKVRFKNQFSSPKTEKKDFAKISRIIRIIASEKKESANPIFSKVIDWSHRWNVRGHWRRLAPGKIGKDRSGEYCIAGQTWVSEFEKGPEGAPVIKKTRVVESLTKS